MKSVKFFIKETNKIAFSSNDDKRIQSTDSIEAYAYGMSKDVTYKKEEIKYNNIIKQSKQFYLRLYFLNWPQIPDHPYRILIAGSSGFGKTNTMFNLIKNEQDINKICIDAKDSFDEKYQLLINKTQSTGLDYSQAFIEYSIDVDDVYKNNE